MAFGRRPTKARPAGEPAKGEIKLPAAPPKTAAPARSDLAERLGRTLDEIQRLGRIEHVHLESLRALQAELDA